MNQSASPTLSERSRLVRLLTGMSDSKFSDGDYNLAEQLGRIVSLSDSISLSRSLGQLSRKVAENPSSEAPAHVNAVQQHVLESREKMMRTIINSFADQTGSSGIQLPSVSTGTKAEALKTYEPYQRFYSMHQAEMAGSIQALRLGVRASISGVSSDLRQLAELDQIINDSIAAHNGKLFNVTPKLLQQRFKELLSAHQQSQGSQDTTEPLDWLRPGAWLTVFYKELQELLLAELDVRLQPVLGLLEALNDASS